MTKLALHIDQLGVTSFYTGARADALYLDANASLRPGCANSTDDSGEATCVARCKGTCYLSCDDLC